MVTAAQWLEGARLRTWPAAVSPVVVGTGAAAHHGAAVAWKAVLALIVALALQIGVNFANDYSDGIRGTDADRVGPLRLVGSGVAAPTSVRTAAVGCFALSAVCGAVLALTSAWWLLLVGAAAIAAAWFYTGGRTPYGYRALGELSVFCFFGLVAVLGTTYVQAGRVDRDALLGAVAVGLHACALLTANNLRDIPTDALTGKRTLAVVMGVRGSRSLYVVLVVLAYLCLAAMTTRWAWLALIALPLSVWAAGGVLSGRRGLSLIPVLRATGQAELLFAVALGVGLAA